MKHIPAIIILSCALCGSFSAYGQNIDQNTNSTESVQTDSVKEAQTEAQSDIQLHVQTATDSVTENIPESSEIVQNAQPEDVQNPVDEEPKQASIAITDVQNVEKAEPKLSPEEEAELAAALAEDSLETSKESTKTNPIASFVQSMNPDMAFIADFALAWFSDKEKNYQQGAHDPAKTGFNLQQLELSVSASVDHLFRFDSNLVFSLSGVEIEEVVATTTALPYGLQLRAGQFLSRVGRINATHPHTWDFVDQVFMISKFYGPEGNRGLGLELSWLPQLPWYAELAVAAQMPSSSASNRSFMNNTSDIEGVQDFLYTFTLKQFFPFNDETGLLWGLSAQTAPNNTGRDNRTEIYGTDLTLKWNPHDNPEMALVMQAEAMFRVRHVSGDMLFDAAGYAQLVWQINREWATGIRGEYGSGVENDTLDPDWTDHRGRLTLQGTWSPSHFTRLRAQGSVDFPTWQSPIYALMLALEVNVGTHPAHSF